LCGCSAGGEGDRSYPIRSGLTNRGRAPPGEIRPGSLLAAGVDRVTPLHPFAPRLHPDLHHKLPGIAPIFLICQRSSGITRMFAPPRISQAPGPGLPPRGGSPFLVQTVQTTILICTYISIFISNSRILPGMAGIFVCTFSETPVQTRCKGVNLTNEYRDFYQQALRQSILQP